MSNGLPDRPLCISGGLILADAAGEPHRGTLLVERGRIAAVAHGPAEAALESLAADRVDASGLVVMPGLVNAHHHAYANVLRGTENSLPLELWALYTVAFGRALDAQAIRLAILLGAAEMLRAGVTACIDHFPHVGLAEHAYCAHRESGMRVGFAPFLHDIHDHDFLAVEMTDDLRARLAGAGFPTRERLGALFDGLVSQSRGDGDRVAILLGPNAPQRCSPELQTLWRTLRDRHGLVVHTHLLETYAQAAGSRARWAGGLVGEMERQGLLHEGLGVAHGVWLTDREREILARHHVAVSHNPASNLMLGSGIMPYAAHRALGITMGLGSDSANTGGGADLFEIMRLAMMLPRVATRDWTAWPKPAEVLAMATQGGAAMLGRSRELGRLAPGMRADLVLLDLSGSAAIAARPSVATIVQHGGPAAVRAVMVDGAWALRNGHILAFDEDAVRREFAAFAPRILAEAEPGLVLAREAAEAIGRSAAVRTNPE
ncbi:MAG: amidohydrolase family protein [Alphaproteobacteria bacterium]|nr:amidohydrolase family protein [Alphaproteobacteria bacterium]